MRSGGAVLALAAFAAAAACRSEPPPLARASAPAPALPTVSAPDAATPARAALPSLEALAARAAEVAPGMREVARGEGPLPATIPLPASTSDTCVRAVLGAREPVVGALVAGGRAAELTRAGTTALLGARGPVCLLKGQDARIEVQGPEGVVRYVVWESP